MLSCRRRLPQFVQVLSRDSATRSCLCRAWSGSPAPCPAASSNASAGSRRPPSRSPRLLPSLGELRRDPEGLGVAFANLNPRCPRSDGHELWASTLSISIAFASRSSTTSSAVAPARVDDPDLAELAIGYVVVDAGTDPAARYGVLGGADALTPSQSTSIPTSKSRRSVEVRMVSDSG